MKKKTIEKFIKNLESQINSGLSKYQFERKNISKKYFSSTYRKIKDAYNNNKINEEEYKIICDLYEPKETIKASVELSNIDEERNKVSFIEDDNGKIIEYSFDIKIKNKPSLKGTFSREEMNMVYRLYSSYGSKLSQREVSRFFPEFNLYDFKRILRAFNITKASAQFAPHVIRENSEEQLLEMAHREKENLFLTTLEAEQNRKNANLVKEYFTEIQKLKNNNNRLDSIFEKFFNSKQLKSHKVGTIKFSNNVNSSNRIGIFHISDLHIGAKVNPESLYENEYNIEVIRTRLTNLANKIISGNYNQVVINLLGDMLDGMDNQTCRRDHVLPQNMNNFEQVNNFLLLMDEFFTTLNSKFNSKDIFVYSVSCGNHDGISAYTATKALFYKLQFAYNINCTLFDKFFGNYKIGDHQFIITHGKDDQFMKRGLPLNLDDRTKIIIYEWLEEQGIDGKNIHFIKGDLHNDNINTSYKLDYRNVLSLFGSSDYGMLNFSRANHGVSYEILDNGELLRGNLINI